MALNATRESLAHSQTAPGGFPGAGGIDLIGRPMLADLLRAADEHAQALAIGLGLGFGHDPSRSAGVGRVAVILGTAGR